MSDLGHDITEKELKKVEDLISREYRQAAQELTAKMEKHYADFDRKDAEMKAKVDSGVITKQDYKNWRVGQLAIGKRWESVRDSMTETLVNADKVAADIIRGNSIKAYGENMNYGTYEVEHGSKINTGFSLYDESTVRNLLKDDPKIIPLPKVDIPKDELWNRQKLTSAVTQGILQGESMSGIAKRLSGVAAMDSRAAIRNARTYTTAAENKGRIDSYERANEMGIETKKKWIATLDDRTRVEHRELDNMVVGNDEDFEVDGYSISYPGDPAAEPEMIYNCRCTLVAEIANYDYNDSRNDERLGDMSYEEWKQEKEEENSAENAGEEISAKENLYDYKSFDDKALVKTEVVGKVDFGDIHREGKEVKYATEYMGDGTETTKFFNENSNFNDLVNSMSKEEMADFKKLWSSGKFMQGQQYGDFSKMKPAFQRATRTFDKYLDQSKLDRSIEVVRLSDAQLILGKGNREGSLADFAAMEGKQITCNANMSFAAASEGLRVNYIGPAPTVEYVLKIAEGSDGSGMYIGDERINVWGDTQREFMTNRNVWYEVGKTTYDSEKELYRVEINYGGRLEHEY